MITCPHYLAKKDSKHCVSFVADGPSKGGCLRPDTFMCSEWLKVNPASNAIKPFKLEVQEAPKKDPVIPPGVPIVFDLANHWIRTFKELNVTIGLDCGPVGKLWLVPEYTKKDRPELSVEHAALLCAICSSFPESRVLSFEREQ